MRKALQILGILSDRDMEWIASHGVRRNLAKGATMVAEGQPITSLSIVLDGKLGVRVGSMGGREISTLLSGEIVGEISFVDSRPPGASVVAAQDSVILQVPSDQLHRKLENDDAFAARFYRAIAVVLSDRLRTTSSRFGYGTWQEDSDPDELDEESMDGISMAAQRFDDLLRRFQVDRRSELVDFVTANGG